MSVRRARRGDLEDMRSPGRGRRPRRAWPPGERGNRMPPGRWDVEVITILSRPIPRAEPSCDVAPINIGCSFDNSGWWGSWGGFPGVGRGSRTGDQGFARGVRRPPAPGPRPTCSWSTVDGRHGALAESDEALAGGGGPKRRHAADPVTTPGTGSRRLPRGPRRTGCGRPPERERAPRHPHRRRRGQVGEAAAGTAAARPVRTGLRPGGPSTRRDGAAAGGPASRDPPGRAGPVGSGPDQAGARRGSHGSDAGQTRVRWGSHADRATWAPGAPAPRRAVRAASGCSPGCWV